MKFSYLVRQKLPEISEKIVKVSMIYLEKNVLIHGNRNKMFFIVHISNFQYYYLCINYKYIVSSVQRYIIIYSNNQPKAHNSYVPTLHTYSFINK